MSVRHHPGDETLVRWASGLLPAGPAVVVATHLAGCAVCRAGIGRFEAVAGALLAEAAPAGRPDQAQLDQAQLDQALSYVLHRMARPMARPAVAGPRRAAPAVRMLADGLAVPAALAGCGIGPWRWAAPGVRRSRVSVPADPGAPVILVRIEPGRALPEHTHTGTEFTQVLCGSFADRGICYGPGDLAEADEDVAHRPVVQPGGVCICLAAIDGRMRLPGLLGRLLQPLAGF